MSLGNVIVGSINLKNDYGVWVNGRRAYDGAQRDVTTVKVPGRNGDLLFDNNRFQNFTLEYSCLMRREAIEGGMFTQLREKLVFLYSRQYSTIIDTYRPDGQHKGRLISKINPSNIVWGEDVAFFNLQFDCKPQFYLFDGQQETTITSTETLSKLFCQGSPIIKVYGYGTFQLFSEEDGATITVSQGSGMNPEYTEIDTETGEAYGYEGSVIYNLNPYVMVNNVGGGNDYPKVAQRLQINILSGISRIVVQPRWWTI